MSNYIMHIDLFGNSVHCETDGYMVNLNDLERAGNAWRLARGMRAYQLHPFLSSKLVEDYISAASEVWRLPKEAFLRKVGRGSGAKTLGHVSIAVLLAEQISPFFHAQVHKTFIEGKILEFRDSGGTEFKNLNSAIDLFLPGREGKDNKGIYIQCALKLRNKILGSENPDWAKANADQTFARYDAENKLCTMLQLGVVRDFEHLKELIQKV